MLDRLASLSPYSLALLRIMASLLFLAHGTQKLLGFPAAEGAAGGPLPPLMLLGGVLELGGGLLLLVGLLTRPVAFVLSGMMAVAYFMFHAPQSFFPILNGGDAAILYCFAFLHLFVAGPGAWSVDGALSRSRRPGLA